ncbi:uncharacterized protein LOC111630550 [Centruroides sculpturatus]|uniref:uncharacterized protein LOC111630550 n=1 Tax=Centruroides sculpturatus TaxID=218467 RepID=UPI000C6D08E7|nr:uncharacterized protein LOC111630550 [Centruroides sculpturatus]
MAWCLRFITNELREKDELICIIKNVQTISFSEEIKCIQSGKSLPKSSKIRNLCPFLDNDNILRVGGRLQNATLNFYNKHPAILPTKHYLTKCILTYFHRKYLHLTRQALLYQAKPVVSQQRLGQRSGNRGKLPQMGQRLNSNLFGTFDQRSASRASFEVAWLIAQNKKPYTIGEDLVKPAAVKMAEIMCGQKEAKKLNSVPLSARIVKERISILAENVKEQVDETTDFSSNSQLMVYVRYKGADNFEEELLFCSPLELRSRGIDVYNKLGNLPYERVNQNYVFNCTGIDFYGHFLIKYKNQRINTYNKIYVCIFICFVTRAIHLETVSDLTSDSFIATLKRFFSRHGKSAKLFTDNAKTFIGAQAELKQLYNMVNKPNEKLANYLSSENIQWNFNPPRAPNFSGLWEAGVKSFKYHLKRVVGGTILTLEEFLTITNQIKEILNSCPISPLSVEPDDLEVLTPAHFLIGRPIDTLPEIDLKSLSDNRLSHWQRVTKMTQIIWKQWTNTYLNNLQQRNKWMMERDNIKIGTLVIIKEDNIPIFKWLVGRITEVFPGSDGKVRVVSVKTKNSVFKRSVSKICVLSMEN